jgi:FdhD protein
VQPPPVAPEAIRRALDRLGDHQPMRARTQSVHAAAWCDCDGTIRLAREDVGRHSALDKAIGAASRAGLAFGAGFVVLSSRCGFELVQKAAAVGIGLIASVSAPTGLALTAAGRAGMTLAATARGGGLVLFDRPGEAAGDAPC